MKQVFILLFVWSTFLLNAQGIDENLKHTNYYEAILSSTILKENLDYFEDPHNNGFIDKKTSDDGKYVTYTYKTINLDRLLVVKSTYSRDIVRVIFIIVPDFDENETSFETDKFIVNFLNKYCSVLKYNTIWKSQKLTFEHYKDNSGIGTLIISNS